MGSERRVPRIPAAAWTAPRSAIDTVSPNAMCRARHVWLAFSRQCHTGRVTRRICILLAAIGISGCATSLHDRAWLDNELLDRTGASTCGRSHDALPDGVSLEDGLDEGEVISITLCRNPTLRAELTRIDAAFATLREARRPANPQVSIMGPIGTITAVATLLLPLESLWQMPSRARAAAREADMAGEAVLMRALDVIRDARLLHVELGLATDRVEARAELERVALDVARIASVRASVGEVSPMEERVLAAEARAGTDARELAETEVAMARARLVATLAIDSNSAIPLLATFSRDVASPPGAAALIDVARAARPDVRSAELAIAASTARAGWERSRVVNLSALVETQWHQPAGPALRLGGRVELPIFGANPGGVGRADAEVERATAQHELMARTVVMDVTLAQARFEQATRSRGRFETEVLPALEQALEMATGTFESGDQTYLVVLDVLRRTNEARLRRAELIAEQRRALCELERSIGARLQSASDVARRATEARGTP